MHNRIRLVKDLDDDEFIPFCIAANKIDLMNDRKIFSNKGKELADELGAVFIECSAKQDINITDLFQTTTLLILEDKQNKINSYYDVDPTQRHRCSLC
ncbi:Ras family protein [Entamoeba marina]